MRRCFGCTDFSSDGFAVLSRAAAKSASARLRKLGVLRVAPDWQRRLRVCGGCSLHRIVDGVAHCGKPLLSQVRRSPEQGCGCPINDKARRPAEHCPVTSEHTPRTTKAACDCKWCST